MQAQAGWLPPSFRLATCIFHMQLTSKCCTTTTYFWAHMSGSAPREKCCMRVSWPQRQRQAKVCHLCSQRAVSRRRPHAYAGQGAYVA